MKYKYDAQRVKHDARGRWEQVLSDLAPALNGAVDRRGKHVPCPVHGGRDGFRVFPDVDATGGGVCNTCGYFADGFSLLMWINSWDFARTVREVAEHLGTGDAFTVFKLAPRWFSLEQTEGEEYTEPVESPQWNAEVALAALGITLERFDLMDGNVQGYAVKRGIAVSPIAEYPHKTRFHEIAHVVLGHTQEADCHDAALTPKTLWEVEAEGVAFLLCSLRDLPGRDESRGYIQSWLADGQLPEKSAQRIFSASQKILEAGRPGDRTAVTQ